MRTYEMIPNICVFTLTMKFSINKLSCQKYGKKTLVPLV